MTEVNEQTKKPNQQFEESVVPSLGAVLILLDQAVFTHANS
jgi:hypothetical protein